MGVFSLTALRHFHQSVFAILFYENLRTMNGERQCPWWYEPKWHISDFQYLHMISSICSITGSSIFQSILAINFISLISKLKKFFFWILFIFLYSRFLLVINFIHISVYMSIPIAQFITPPPPPPPPLSPLGVHMFVLYICVSISALQTGSSVPFF